jgi:hypothetical protein
LSWGGKLTGLEPGKLVLPAGTAGLVGGVSSNKTPPFSGPNLSVKPVLFREIPVRNTESPAFRSQDGAGALYERQWLETPQTHTEALARMVRSLNLPPDSLSSALVSFARYFSLSLDPALLTHLRREALSLKLPRESAALAAASAADKGVELTPEALERYAAAIDPDARREQSGADSPEGGRDGFNRGEDEDTPGRLAVSGAPDAETLKKIYDDIDGNDPLLSILNSIPGGDGNRWIVYPFQVSAGGKRFRVTVRVRAGKRKDDARLAVDVAGGERRWLFVMNRPACSPEGAEAGISEVRVSIWPPTGRRERDVLEREIREVLGPLGGRVVLRDGEPLLADCRNEVLSSINEEV